MRVPLSLLLVCTFISPLQAQYVPTWDPDSDGDNLITVNDLLALLGVFEEADSDDDGIFDSQDDCMGSYDACGVCNGTGVDADVDSVCDDVDPCVGALDSCGLCNGPGPSVPVIDEIVFMTDSVYLPPMQQWYVFSFAVDTLYTYVCPVQGCTDTNAANFNPLAVIEDGSCLYGPAQCGGQSTVIFDDHTYALVGIGTQCWFAENLRSDNYRNGDAIPGELSNSSWQNTNSGAQAIHSSNVLNSAVHGRLYNWFAVNDIRGLCPTGFHVPSDGEWISLEIALGMTSAQANGWDWRGTDQGTQLKSSPTDSPQWNGTNTYLFSALPAGYRDNFGNFLYFDSSCDMWTANSDMTNALSRVIKSAETRVFRGSSSKRYGFSVRCVRD